MVMPMNVKAVVTVGAPQGLAPYTITNAMVRQSTRG